MKRLILLALWVAPLAAVLGCGESPEKTAADRIADQADVARRMYVNAVGMMTGRPMDKSPQDPNRILDVRPVDEAALAVLDQAAGVANKALQANPQATAIGKIPAYRILAEIDRQKAVYFARLAAIQVDETQRLCRRAELQAFALSDLGRLADFYRLLASLDPSQVQALLAAARQELQQNQATRKDLADNQQAIEGQIADSMRELEPLAPRARQLRQQAKATKGLESLGVLSQAEQIERQADLREARINQLKVQLEQVISRDKIADAQIEGVSNRVTALEGCIKDIANRGQIVASRQQELTAATAATTGAANALIKDLAAKFAAAIQQHERALAAYEEARGANKNVLAGIGKLSSQAKAAEPPGPPAPGAGPTLLGAMAAPSGKLPAVAREAELALAAGDTRRQVLELVSQAAALQARLTAAAGTAKVSLGEDLAQAVLKVADLPAKAEQTKADYQTAQQEFEMAANLASGAKELKGSAWVYQVQRVQAIVGLYLLSKEQGQADAEHLANARRQITDIRTALEKEHPLTVDMACVDAMDRALQQIQ